MGDESASDQPLEAAAGGTAPHAIEAFELLANETRLAILLALWDAREPFTSSSGVPFSRLREQVGRPDSGQFNYHLGKLEDEFITSTDDGYKLRAAGDSITRAIVAGAGLKDPTLDSTELDIECPLCQGATGFVYREGRLFHRCLECEGKYTESDEFPRGTLAISRLHPAGVTDRSPEEAYLAASVGKLQRAIAMVDGVCPDCSGKVDSELEVCPDHGPGSDGVCPNCGRSDEAVARYECTVCKFSLRGSPSETVSMHPAAISFYYDHGVNLLYDLDYQAIKRAFELREAHQQTVLSTDPARIRVSIQYDGDELGLLIDDRMNVTKVID